MKTNLLKLLTEQLVGRTIIVKNQYHRDERLVVEKINNEHHSVEIGESNASNDWWPATSDWQTLDITFTNGYKKEFSLSTEFELVGVRDNDAN